MLGLFLKCGFFLIGFLSLNVGELVFNSCEIFGINMKGLKIDLEEKVFIKLVYI